MKRLDILYASMTDRLKAGLPGNYYYHGLEHTLDVFEAAGRIGKLEGLNLHELELLQVAALYHDSGFLEGAKDHESTSCRYAKEDLPKMDFSAQEVELICGMIMATRYPQQPQNRLEEILCDADLDYLGRTDFFSIAEKLRKELTETGQAIPDDEWNDLQIRFLDQHRYFTVTAKTSRAPKKAEHLLQIRQQSK